MHNPNKEATNINLEIVRKDVMETTNQIFELFCKRQKLMSQIAASKKGANTAELPIFLPEKEQSIRSHFRKEALKRNVDPDMADMLIYMLMSSAKFSQMNILERSTVFDIHRPSDMELKNNLLELAAKVAPLYDQYAPTAIGRKIEYKREKKIILELTKYFTKGTALNLGCANGSYVTKILNEKFENNIGYDISPEMIEAAKKKYPDNNFYVHDIHTGIPVPNNSINLIISNLGATSGIYYKEFWNEIHRILAPDGIAYLSFYNKNSLVTKWWTPWSNSFNLKINPYNNTIMVPIEDNEQIKVYWIDAKLITEDELYRDIYSNGFKIMRMESSSPLWDDKPNEFYKHEEAVNLALRYEETHAHIPPFIGQYIRLTIQK